MPLFITIRLYPFESINIVFLDETKDVSMNEFIELENKKKIMYKKSLLSKRQMKRINKEKYRGNF